MRTWVVKATRVVSRLVRGFARDDPPSDVALPTKVFEKPFICANSGSF